MKKILFAMMSAALLWQGSTCVVRAADAGDVDKLTTYAVILGRGAGCGFSVSKEMRQVGRWIDRTFVGREKNTYLKIFMAGVEQNAEQQAAGKSPDSCASVRKTIDNTVWP